MNQIATKKDIAYFSIIAAACAACFAMGYIRGKIDNPAPSPPTLKERLADAEAEADRLRKELGEEYRDYAAMAQELARCREETAKPKAP